MKLILSIIKNILIVLAGAALAIIGLTSLLMFSLASVNLIGLGNDGPLPALFFFAFYGLIAYGIILGIEDFWSSK